MASASRLRSELATTLSITTDDALAARIGRRTQCCAENLEAFSVTAYLDARHIRYAHAGQPASVHLADGRKLSAIVRDKPEIATRLPETARPPDGSIMARPPGSVN